MGVQIETSWRVLGQLGQSGRGLARDIFNSGDITIMELYLCYWY
jgi:hypothetical protein